VADGRACGEWTIAFWEGPGPREVADYFAYERHLGLPEGVSLPWSTYMAERMWAIIEELGYLWRE
jgi:hypothetical protein